MKKSEFIEQLNLVTSYLSHAIETLEVLSDDLSEGFHDEEIMDEVDHLANELHNCEYIAGKLIRK
jgi:hypothetical protein